MTIENYARLLSIAVAIFCIIFSTFPVADAIHVNSREEDQAKYDPFSAKIERKVLDVMTSTNPDLIAKKIGASYQAGRITVYVYLDESYGPSPPPGIDVSARADNILVSKLTLQEINQLSQLDSVNRITLPIKPVFRGHAVSEGVGFTNADLLHAGGITGTGVTVAVIDSGFFTSNAEMPANYTSAEITLSGSIFIDDSINATLPSESGSNQTSTIYKESETTSEISQTGTSIESTTNYTSSESQTIAPSSDTSDDEVSQPVLQVDLISLDTVQAENMTAGNENTTNYLTVSNTELNQDLNQLTISVWVRPNYANGSTELAVVGKENSFLLSINNIIPPEKTAIFSVFDGIAWSTVTGSTQIRQEGWTHLAAIVNGTEVSLYQNGVLQDTMTLNDVFAISDGNLNLVSADVAGSESDVIIGAYVETTRGKYKITKQFSGEIKNVLIYKNALSEEEIYNIFSTSTPADKESSTVEIATAETIVRELTTVRKKLVTLDKFDTRYENFSASISEIGSQSPLTHSNVISTYKGKVDVSKLPQLSQLPESAKVFKTFEKPFLTKNFSYYNQMKSQIPVNLPQNNFVDRQPQMGLVERQLTSTQSPEPQSPFSLLTAFEGLDFASSGNFIPPDTQVAAGPNHIMEMVNTHAKI